MILNAFFWSNSILLLSPSDNPECHSGTAYSVIGLRIEIQAVNNSSFCSPKCFNLLINPFSTATLMSHHSVAQIIDLPAYRAVIFTSNRVALRVTILLAEVLTKSALIDCLQAKFAFLVRQ